MTLEAYESELVGNWVMREGQMMADATEARIKELIANRLREVRVGNWRKLYVDPSTGTYWELTYPQSEMHGGGPMKLSRISTDQAQQKYGV